MIGCTYQLNVELRHLRYFVAVAEELHFGRAADRLKVAQPSLSQQIRKLERQIGADLFDRTNRRVELTAAGAALLPGATRTLEDAGTAIEQARDAAAGVSGHLTVGFIETAAITVVPQAVRRFRAAHPGIALTLLELGVGEQTEGLLSGRLDFGFIRERSKIESLRTETVLEEKLVVAVPAGHDLAGRSRLAVGSLTEEPLVAVERNMLPELYDDTLRMLRENGGNRDFAQNASSVLAVLGLVSAGLGLAILPASVEAIRLAGVDFVPLTDSPQAAILMAMSEISSSPHRRFFLEAVRAGTQTRDGLPAR